MEKKAMKLGAERQGSCCNSGSSPQGDIKVYLLLAMVGLILVVSVVQSFQIRELKAKSLAVSSAVVAATASASGSLDMTGWTEDEKMMYEHHGTVPERLKGKVSSPAAASTGSGMVGGC